MLVDEQVVGPVADTGGIANLRTRRKSEESVENGRSYNDRPVSIRKGKAQGRRDLPRSGGGVAVDYVATLPVPPALRGVLLMDSLLPADLTRGLPDSEIEVLGWSAESGELSLRVRKDIGPETGVLRFHGVARVNLAPRFTISSLIARPRNAEDEFADEGDVVFLFEDAWFEKGFVVAESVSYVRDE